MRTFATGFRDDATPRKYPGHVQIAMANPVVQEFPTVLRYRGPWLWQGAFGMCFPYSVTRAVDCQERAEMDAYETLDGDGVLLSPVYGYGVARAQEYAGLDIQQLSLEDNGVSPGLLEDGYREMGIVPMTACPGPDRAGFDISMIYNLTPEKWQPLIEKAYKNRGLVMHEIDVAPSGRVDAMADLLRRFTVPIVAWYVDDAYMANRGELVTSMSYGSPNHAEAILEVDSDEVIIENYWRNESQGYVWGQEDGTGRIAPALFERLPQSQVRIFAVTFCPKVES